VSIGTPTSIGQGGTASSGASVAFNTTAIVAAGNLIVVDVGYYGAAITATMSGGGLTWTQDKNQQGAADTNYHQAKFSAPAPAGLASATTLTCTFSGSASNPMIAGTQCSGLASSSRVDTTSGQNTTGTSTAWAAGSVTTGNANDLIMGACAIDGTRTSTATTPSLEIHDFQNAGAATTLTTAYRIESATGTYSIAGTLSATLAPERVGSIVAYKAAAGGATTNVTLTVSSASSATLGRQVKKTLSATTGASASMPRAVAVSRSASAGSAAVMSRSVARALSVVAGSVGRLGLAPGKVLAVSAGSSASVVGVRVRLLTLAAAAGSVASVAEVTSRVLTLSASVAATVVLARGVRKTVLAGTTANATMTTPAPAGGRPGQLPTMHAG
jgi:hypothetical protein